MNLNVSELSFSEKEQLLRLLEEKEQRDLIGGHLAKIWPNEGPLSWKNYPKHMKFIAAGKEHRERFFSAANRAGKALPLWETVMTPDGPVKMGDLIVGDYVIDEHGDPVKVVQYTDQGIKPCYKFTTYEGSNITSCEDHLWLTRTTDHGAKGEYTIKNTKQIAESDKVHVLPPRPAIKYNQRELPIDPYLMGLLIGDGSLSHKGLLFTTADEEIVKYCEEIAPQYECEFRKYGAKYAYGFTSYLKSPTGFNYNIIKDCIDGYGLNCTSHHKFIPEDYKYGSVEDRLELLQGLMDTDGTCGEAGHTEFYTVSEQLAKDVQELVHSLGGNASLKVKIGNYKNKVHYSYRVYIYSGTIDCPFKLTRKAKNYRSVAENSRGMSIKQIDYAGEHHCACITVDSESGLFVAGPHLVTHNSITGAYELACHLTGLYPDWWPGRKFDHAIEAWACGDTSQTTRDIVQKELLGPPGAEGTGMVSADRIENIRKKAGVPDAVESFKVKHESGDYSYVGFKSYDQGRRSFQGTAKHFIWCDEEVPADVYGECVIRTMTTKGLIIVTATPLKGLTPFVQDFMENAVNDTDENINVLVG